MKRIFKYAHSIPPPIVRYPIPEIKKPSLVIIITDLLLILGLAIVVIGVTAIQFVPFANAMIVFMLGFSIIGLTLTIRLIWKRQGSILMPIFGTISIYFLIEVLSYIL